MDLSERRWEELTGAYRTPYDPRPAIRRLAAADNSAWQELWLELHHQGDVGDASYAAVPEIVRFQAGLGRPDWNAFALAATIEEARRTPGNPPLPDDLEAAYRQAWESLPRLALDHFAAADDDTLVRSILAVLALAKDQTMTSSFALLGADEQAEVMALWRGQ